MGIEFRECGVMFHATVYEDEVALLREFLQTSSPERVMFDFSECDDIHLAVLQVVLAYAKHYSAEYRFGYEVKVYQKVCEGFIPEEENCA